MTRRSAVQFALALTAIGGFALAQTPETFTARLTWVPISLAQQNDVSGEGSATATLSGSTLSISGTFEGLPATATVAHLHRGAATGARGPVIADLEVTHGTEGTVSGKIELNTDQLEALLAGCLYIQLHAQHGVPPDNAVLHGWLIKQATTFSPSRRKKRQD